MKKLRTKTDTAFHCLSSNSGITIDGANQDPISSGTKNMKNRIILILLLVSVISGECFAQNINREIIFKQPDKLKQGRVFLNLNMPSSFTETKVTSEVPFTRLNQKDTNYVAPERYKTRMPRALILPGVLIGYGLTTIGSHGLYSSRQARTDILSMTGGKGSNIDDYLIYAPYVEFGALLLFKVKCRNDFLNTTLLIVKSELLNGVLTYSLKYLAHEERPYSYQSGLDGVPLVEREQNKQAFLSMPSGHTSEAFVAATIVNKEYRYRNPWIGISAYALAATVGVFRMINDQHWESDVFVGAGVGVLSANIVYATHQHRWGRNEICFAPTFNRTNKGVLFAYRF
jgi:membrane-associated phospholipid phosphatase